MLLAKRETFLIAELLLREPIRSEDKLLSYMLRATSRDEVSSTTMSTIKKLRPAKQARLEKLAHSYLTPNEYELYKKKTKTWLGKPLHVKICYLNFGFSKMRAVQREAMNAFREGV